MSKISSTSQKSASGKTPQKVSRVWLKILRFNPEHQRKRLNHSDEGGDSEGFPIAIFFVLLCSACAAALIFASFW